MNDTQQYVTHLIVLFRVKVEFSKRFNFLIRDLVLTKEEFKNYLFNRCERQFKIERRKASENLMLMMSIVSLNVRSYRKRGT